MQAIALCGRQSCLQAAFQAAVQQTTHAVRTYSSGFVFAGIPQRSLRNSSRIGNGGLKGRLQARLPATRKACRHAWLPHIGIAVQSVSDILISGICHEPANRSLRSRLGKTIVPILSRDQRERFCWHETGSVRRGEAPRRLNACPTGLSAKSAKFNRLGSGLLISWNYDEPASSNVRTPCGRQSCLQAGFPARSQDWLPHRDSSRRRGFAIAEEASQ